MTRKAKAVFESMAGRCPVCRGPLLQRDTSKDYEVGVWTLLCLHCLAVLRHSDCSYD